MKFKAVLAGALLAALAVPLSAQAQGVPGGAAHGFREGGRIAGPVGAVVGTAVGGVIGGVEGALGINHRHNATVVVEEPGPRVRTRRYYRSKYKKSRRGYRHARRYR
jgi:hypothetical protein